jgi:hypothetical protein
MASNVTIPATGTGTATPVVSTDQVSADSSQVQNVQLATVSAGVLSRVSASAPLQVAIVGTVPISGAPTTVTANLGTIGGAATQTTLAAVLSALGTPLQAGGSVAVTSSALPTGAATQTTLAAIAGQLPAALGAHGGLVIEGVASGVAIPVTGGGTPTDQQVTQTFTSAITGTPVTGLNAISTVVVEVITTGNTATGVTWNVQGSQDGTNWEGLPWMSGGALTYNSPGTGASNATGIYYWTATGFAQVRMNVVAISAGNFPTNLRTTSSAVSARQATVALGSGSSVIGKVGIDQTTPGTTNLVATELTTGLTTFSNTALTSTAVAVKASAGKLHGYILHNPSAATTFIQVWNIAVGSVTVGTTAPTYVIPIPSGASANVSWEKGVTHSTAITVAATTTATGSTAPATAAVVALFYV